MTLRKPTYLIAIMALLLASVGQIYASQPVEETFKSAPSTIFPLLSKNTRLDMLDYFNSGMDTPSKNDLGGNSRIESLTDHSICISTTSASKAQLAILPYNGTELVTFISTVMTPAADSRISIFTSDWSQDLTSKVFKEPTLADWLTPAGKKKAKEVETMIPFMLVDYSYNPETGLLTLTNNTASALSDDDIKTVQNYLFNHLDYHWNGKKFEKVK